MNERMKQAAESGDINALDQLIGEDVNLLAQKDDEGNTVLHIAVSKNQTQVVGHLLAWGSRFVDVNSTNLEGKTAWDISQGQTQVNNREIKLMLHIAGASLGLSLSTTTRSDDNNIDEFYNLIRENVNLLEDIDKPPFVNTPFHIAASYGNIQFALELMSLKPSFARKLNPNGFSPIHLALQNRHIELVHRLLQLDGDLARVNGKERLTPSHYVVKSGEHLYLLDEFLSVCPDSITDVTVRNEIVLHIALKNENLKAFKFFVGWLAKDSSENAEFNKRRVLNWKDNEGNTVLHILVSKYHPQDVRHFLSWCEEFVDVNLKNLEDKTAWDILREDNTEIRDMLRRAGAKPGSSNRDPDLMYQMTAPPEDAIHKRKYRRKLRKLAVEWRDVLLMVAALLATLSFQAVLTPPGGIWQDNGECITAEPGSIKQYCFLKYCFSNYYNKRVGSTNHPHIIYLSQFNTTLARERKAGTAIALQDGLPFSLFLLYNSILFAVSNSLIFVLFLNSFKVMFLGLDIILFVTYYYSMYTTTQGLILTIAIMINATFHFALLRFLSWKQ